MENYLAAFAEAPPRIATVAYDATALVAVLSERGAMNASSGGRALLDPNGFAGTDGLFRLNANGLTERGLAILEIQGQDARLVEDGIRVFPR